MWPFGKEKKQERSKLKDKTIFKTRCMEVDNCLSQVLLKDNISRSEVFYYRDQIVVSLDEAANFAPDAKTKDECLSLAIKIKAYDWRYFQTEANYLRKKVEQWLTYPEKERFAFTELDKNHVNIKNSLKIESVSHDAYLNKQMQYFEVPVRVTTGKCSDKDCPCPETSIPYGSGYLYISQNLVDFRQDALTVKALEAKIERLGKFLGSQNLYYFGPGVATPILMCEQAAKLRNLDLKTAYSDANYWWKTGLVPLRATPIVPDAKKDQYKSLSNLLIFENDEFLKAYQCRNCLKTFSSDELTNKIWQKCPVCQEEHIATKPSITCPGCKRAIWIPIGKEGILTCPFCTNQFQINTISDKQK